MGNAPSSSTALSSSSRNADPATRGMEADLEKLGVRRSSSGAAAIDSSSSGMEPLQDAITEEDHAHRNQASRRRSTSVGCSKPSKRPDPAKMGMRGDLEMLGADAPTEGLARVSRTRRASKLMTDGSAKSKNNTKTTEKASKRGSMKNHMKEIEEFVTAVQNSKDAKRQLREGLAAGSR